MSCCHPALNQTCAYRSVDNQSAATNGDESVAFKKKEKKKEKEAPLLVYYCQGLTQSISPSSASDMAERSSSAPSTLPRRRIPAPHFARRSTSTPREPVRTDYLCFPVSCVRRRRISVKVDPWQLGARFHICLTLSAPRPDASL